MKREKLTVKKNKKTYTGEVVWPDDLIQAVNILGELEVWEAFKVGYLALAKKRITGTTPRQKRWAKVDLLSLDEQMRSLIQALVFEQQRKEPLPLHQPSQTQPQYQESPARVEQQKAQTDYDETQEEASNYQIPQSDESFEQDFARYLASLDSSLQSQKEERSGRLG